MVHIPSVLNLKDKSVLFNGNADRNRCLCHVQADRLLLCIFPANGVKSKIVALVNNHGICLNIKLMADLWERINIVVHGIDQLFLYTAQAIFSCSWEIAENRECFYQHTHCFRKSGIVSSMVNSGKYSILFEIIFSKCDTKSGNEEYILRNSMLFTEFLHILHGNGSGLSVVKFCCWSRTVFVRIEADASTCMFKYWLIIILCIFIDITCQGISVIQCQIIGSITFRFQLLTAVSSVNIINYNSQRCTIGNNVVKVQEQIIAITGSVDFKPEKLFIKQHIWTYQSVSVHSV